MVGDGNEHHKYGFIYPIKSKKLSILKVGKVGIATYFLHPFFLILHLFFGKQDHIQPTILTQRF